MSFAKMNDLYSMQLEKRQNDGFFEPDDDLGFWQTNEGDIIRWTIFGAIVFLLLLWGIVGRLHATRRIKKGLPPMAYHKWLLTNRERAIHDPSYRPPMPYYNAYAGNYPMNAYPPPVYDQNSPPPPLYQPPPGSSKMDPNQQFSGTTRVGDGAPDYTAPADFAPPAGPPPAHLQTEGEGAGARDVYRV